MGTHRRATRAAAVCAAVGAVILGGGGGGGGRGTARGDVTTWDPSDLSTDSLFTNTLNWTNGVPAQGVDALFDERIAGGSIRFPSTPLPFVHVQSRTLRVLSGHFVFAVTDPDDVVHWDVEPFNLEYPQGEYSVEAGRNPFDGRLQEGLSFLAPAPTVQRPGLSRLTSMRVASFAPAALSWTEVELRHWEWSHAGTLHVGEAGQAEMVVNGRLTGRPLGTPLDLSLGTNDFARGTVEVDGTDGDGNYHVAAATLTVGAAGNGTLVMHHGGIARVDQQLVAGAAAGGWGYVGVGQAAPGTDGSSGHLDAASAVIGDAGQGFLVLSHPDSTLRVGQSLTLGLQAGGAGEAHLSRAAATVGFAVHVGVEGTGRLSVESGATLTSAGGEIASSYARPNAVGAATVTGAGSTWASVGSDIHVANAAASQYGDAFASDGRLVVRDGGRVSVRLDPQFFPPDARGRVVVHPGGRLAGDGTVDADVDLRGAMPGGITGPTVGGILAPGNSPGTITILGNLSHAALAEIQIELAPGASDLVIVGGDATMNGTFTFTAVDGFTAPIGTIIPFLDAGGLLTVGPQVVLNDLTGLGLVLNEPTDAGVLSVTVTAVPEPGAGTGLLLLAASLLRHRRARTRPATPAVRVDV